MRKVIYCCFLATAFFLTSCGDEEATETTNVVEASEAQTDYSERTCNTTEHQASLLSDADYKARFDKRMDKASSLAKSRSSVDCTEPIVLPVAVHFQNLNNPDQACLKALAQTQIDILNADYQALNSDASLWASVASNYPGVEPSNVCVKFCLADQGHPSGSGITDGQPAVTFNTVSGDFTATWSNYINIFVRPDLGFLGYSPLGGSGNGDGVVIDAAAFASGAGCGQVSPSAPYNLGRTLTHELGHYLTLDHLWGDGGCNSDDGIADTPSQDNSNFGCPGANTSSCGSVDLHMSYMDYTNDACMYMFSNQQAANMNSYVTANFQGMINNIGNVCSGNNGGGGDPDADGDGITDAQDNCPTTPNADQTDTDGDGIGDACDTTEPTDTDGDGVADEDDNCPTAPNADQTDTDGDGIGDVCDTSEPTDTDGDGVADEDDNCPTTPNVDQTDTDGNGIGDACDTSEPTDTDGDGVADEDDNCPTTPNADQTDTDGDGIGDACDTIDPEGCIDYEVTLSIVPDDYPEEIQWRVTNAVTGQIEFEGGPYDYDSDYNAIVEELCLEDGCYEIEVTDSYGDGICCSYGDGSFSLQNDDQETFYTSDGNYGTSEMIYLCVLTDDINGLRVTKTTKNTNLAKKAQRGSSN